jgi:hypothetical protein
MSATAAMLALAMGGALCGQWLNYPTPGVPRLPDGSQIFRRLRHGRRIANRTFRASGD